MAKRERKAWALISQSGRLEYVAFAESQAMTMQAPGEIRVRCTITWDDGKPEKKTKTKRGGKNDE